MNDKFIGTLPLGTFLHGKRYTYEIRKVLGQGSFGITYLAKAVHTSDPDEVPVFVAIKEFFMRQINDRENNSVRSSSEGGLFSKYRRKFIEESVHLEGLRHANIVRVLESFEENGTNYYTMQYIDGGSLDDCITRSHGLKEKEALRIALKIAGALDYMHSCNLLHLDLKPSNVMMQGGVPILIDFGLSKHYDEDGNPETSTTIGGGTPGYAPLEQLKADINRKGELPVSMDIYALGASIFKMLTGTRPPEASDIFNDGFPEAELISRKISVPTRQLVKSMMAPKKNERPKNMQLVRIEISNILDSLINDETVFEEGTVGDFTNPKKPEAPKQSETQKKPETPKKPEAQKTPPKPPTPPSTPHVNRPAPQKEKSGNSGCGWIIFIIFFILGGIGLYILYINFIGSHSDIDTDSVYYPPIEVMEDSVEIENNAEESIQDDDVQYDESANMGVPAQGSHYGHFKGDGYIRNSSYHEGIHMDLTIYFSRDVSGSYYSIDKNGQKRTYVVTGSFNGNKIKLQVQDVERTVVYGEFDGTWDGYNYAGKYKNGKLIYNFNVPLKPY